MEQLQLNIKWKDIDCGAKPILDNPDDCEIIYEAEKILLTDEKITCLVVRFDGQILKNSGGCLYVNGYPIPLSGIVSMEIKAPTQLAFTLKVPAQSALRIDNIEAYCKYEMQSLYFECDNESDVLVVCPDYPSTDNLYLCAFVHSRVREYINQGLKVQVAVIGSNWYEKQYVFENVSVYCGHYKALKYLLSKKQYKVIVTHFVDTPLFQIYDGYITNEHLIFICHGPETTFRHLNNVCRPYFTAPIKHEDISEDFDVKESYIRKYSQKDNVDWVFVSKWFYEFSRKCCECDFKHYLIINNLIDESIFPYRRKTAEDRKKIIILRKFDNISVHAIDQCVYTVLELSRRPFFKDLNISFYGDGSYWKELIGPLEQFDNVNIHKTFGLS